MLRKRVTGFVDSAEGTALFDCCEQVCGWMLTPGNEPHCPILFLYSKMDRIIRAASVKAYVQQLRDAEAKAIATGGDIKERVIKEHEFPLGQHVVCFWSAAAAYRAQATSFVRECMGAGVASGE
jgi:hypothetical protein